MKPDILELVAEDVHDAWANEKKRQGYADHVYIGEQENWGCDSPGCNISALKHHSDMLPYAELSEHVKNYDRVTAKTVIDSLKKRGFFITNPHTGEEI